MGWCPDASQASQQLTAWQEIVLITVLKVQHAAASCGFRSDVGQIDDLLASAAMTRGDVARQPDSASLARQITADEDSYKGDRDLACSQAWERFGPDGAPGVRDLLGR